MTQHPNDQLSDPQEAALAANARQASTDHLAASQALYAAATATGEAAELQTGAAIDAASEATLLAWAANDNAWGFSAAIPTYTREALQANQQSRKADDATYSASDPEGLQRAAAAHLYASVAWNAVRKSLTR